ncbi:hypothetical protein PV783_16990 [Chitinophaga sp. CC14]|uniref:hypothetical protein n=1 Tax=Chitinophaga sp. CC14 TaxID=3029199 RepID=UPI003B77B51C
MKSLKLVFLFLVFFCLSILIACRNDRSKADYEETVRLKLCKDLYVEMYTVFGSGAFGGDIMGEYLTDSTNFRMFVGTFDNAHETFSYKCEGDSVLIYKRVTGADGSTWVVKSLRTFSLLDLKKKKKFE